MKKFYLIPLLILGIILSSTTSNAQRGRFSLGLDIGIPTGKFSKGESTIDPLYGDKVALYGGNSIGIGISPRFEIPVGSHLGITVTTGGLIFLGVELVVEGDEASNASAAIMIPLQFGAKFYVTENQKGFYIMGEGGMHFVTAGSSSEYAAYNGNNYSESVSRNKLGLSFAPSIGFRLDRWDFGVKYQFFQYPIVKIDDDNFVRGTSMQSYIDLRAAFIFGERN